MHDSDSYAGVLAHSQTPQENNREAELSLENKGHNALYINVELGFIMDMLCRYARSIAPCWLRTPILPGLLYLRPAKCFVFLSPLSKTGTRAPQLSSAGHQGEPSRAREKRHPPAPVFPW